MKSPKIRVPVITFGTWKGGDRDGNPFVVASFTNQTFIDQKEFVLQRYIEIAQQLLDKLTPATDHIPISKELAAEVVKDALLFPYIEHVKSFEPYRSKLRFILEKLEVSTTNLFSKKTLCFTHCFIIEHPCESAGGKTEGR